MLADQGPVEINPESGAIRERHQWSRNFDRGDGQSSFVVLRAQHVPRPRFDPHVRAPHHQVRHRRRPHIPLQVRPNAARHPVPAGELHNLFRPRNPPVLPRVDADHVAAVVPNQFLGINQVKAHVISHDGQPHFPTELRDPRKIPVGGWLFDQRNPQGLHPLHRRDRRWHGPPAIRIDHDVGFRANRLPHHPDPLHVGVGIAPHLDLDGGEPLGDQFQGPRAGSGRIIGPHAEAAADGAVPRGPAQQFVDRLSRPLPRQVPARHLDRRTGEPVVPRGEFQPAIDRRDVGRVQPQDRRAQQVVDHRLRPPDRLATPARHDRRFADPLEAVVGHHPHQHIVRDNVLAQRGHHPPGRLERDADGVGLDVRDLHFGPARGGAGAIEGSGWSARAARQRQPAASATHWRPGCNGAHGNRPAPCLYFRRISSRHPASPCGLPDGALGHSPDQLPGRRTGPLFGTRLSPRA